MTSTWVGGPCLRLHSCSDPQMPQHGHGGDPNGLRCSQAYLNSGLATTLSSQWWALGNWGKKGVMLGSLPPVAVVTASVARDVSEAGVDGEAE